MDELEKYLEAVARGAFSEELGQATGRFYGAMYAEMRKSPYALSDLSAREIVCAHINALGVMESKGGADG